VVGLVEMDLNQLAKATAVVVAQRLGIAKGLQDRVGLAAAAHNDTARHDNRNVSKLPLSKVLLGFDKGSITTHT
jgi:hypothetical protein